jgi:hypothetical protein
MLTKIFLNIPRDIRAPGSIIECHLHRLRHAKGLECPDGSGRHHEIRYNRG